MKEGFASEDAAERITDAVGLTVGEILLPKISGHVENVIEFIKDSERAYHSERASAAQEKG